MTAYQVSLICFVNNLILRDNGQPQTDKPSVSSTLFSDVGLDAIQSIQYNGLPVPNDRS